MIFSIRDINGRPTLLLATGSRTIDLIALSSLAILQKGTAILGSPFSIQTKCRFN